MGPVWFVLPHIYPIVQYDVYSQEPQLHVEPLAGEWPAALKVAAVAVPRGSSQVTLHCPLAMFVCKWHPGSTVEICLELTNCHSSVCQIIRFPVTADFYVQ